MGESVKWEQKTSELPLEKIAKIVYLSIQGQSRHKIAEKIEANMSTVWKYKKLILE